MLKIYLKFVAMRVVVLLIFFIPFFSFAQQKEEQLAAQYFGNNEFEKAVELYEKLNSKNPESPYIYENLLICHFKLNQWNEAEKLVKKQQKRFPTNEYYKVDLGYVYDKQLQSDKRDKLFSALINQLNGTDAQTRQIANAFQKRGYNKEAIQTYQRSRKINGGNQSLFAIPLAQLYGTEKDLVNMVEEYLNEIQSNQQSLEEVQGLLQQYLSSPKEFDILKTALLRRLKSNPSQDAFQELIIWLYVQQKDFENALVQARSLDKRYKEEGRRVMELGSLALQNEAFDAAIQIFTYIKSLGADKPMYLNAQMSLLDARRQKILYRANYTNQDILTLEMEYKQFITENGKYYFTAPTIRELARLYAFYLGNFSSSIQLFNELIDMPRIDNRFRAECKLELGDIYVLKKEEWEAMLLYGQVDKEFNEDPLGREAKFRNAKLSYYLGEFEWAKAQLDVLKTATTQLISNNALELSLLIQDHTIDSNVEPLKIFAQADLLLYQNDVQRALSLLDSLDSAYPRHDLSDDILYKRAEIAIKMKEYSRAVTILEQLLKEYGSGIWGDNALFMQAQIHERYLNKPTEAVDLYTKLLLEYSGSFFTTEARKKIRLLRGEQIN